MPSCSKVHAAAAAAKYLQLCPTLCDPIDGSPPGYPVPRILQARTLELGCHFLLQCMKVKSESEAVQSCPTLSDPMDCSLPGSSLHGIFQARVLEWGAIAFSSPISILPLKYSTLILLWAMKGCQLNCPLRDHERFSFSCDVRLFVSLFFLHASIDVDQSFQRPYWAMKK